MNVDRIKTIAAFLKYNALHIFGGRFFIFLGLALGLFFLVLLIGLLGRGGTPNSERLYKWSRRCLLCSVFKTERNLFSPRVVMLIL